MRSIFPSIRFVLAVVVGFVTMGAAAFVLSKTFVVDGQLAVQSVLLAAIWSAGGIAVWWLGPRRVEVEPRWRRHRWRWTMVVSAAVAFGSFVGGCLLLLWPLTAPWVESALLVASSAPAWVTLVVALMAGAAEEVFFRIGFASLWPRITRWVLPNVIYVVVTVASGNIAMVIAAALLGVSATAVREGTGSVAAPIIVHASWSVMMVGVFPLVAATIMA